jgi:hypothetical protein
MGSMPLGLVEFQLIQLKLKIITTLPKGVWN